MIFGAPMGMSPYWFIGEVVDKNDPTNNKRVRVRVFGIHTDDPPTPDGDKEALDGVEDQDLPWAFCIDGTYGKMDAVPDEGDWVLGFFADGRDCQHPFLMGTIPGSNFDDTGAPAVNRTNPDGTVMMDETNPLSAPEIDEILSGEQSTQARQNAEEYLGRSLSDQEWTELVAATVAESSINSPEEQAAVAGVILNRVRSDRYPNTVSGVLRQRNHFQAVTGTSVNPGPSRNFTNPARSQIASTVSGINSNLANTPRNWVNFTSNNPAAYGPGTNIGFRDQVTNSAGSRVIGGTVFGDLS